MVLEYMAEFEIGLRSLTSEADVHPQKDTFFRVETGADSPGGMQVVKSYVPNPVKDVAGITKQSQIHAGKCLPSVFQVEYQRLFVPKSQFIESPQGFRAAKCRQEKERDLLSRVGIG